MRFEANANEFLLTVDNVARYYIGHGDTIIIAPEPEAREAEIMLFLMGSAMWALLFQRNFLPLHGSARGILDSLTGIEASDLTFSKIDSIRPEVYQQLSENSEEIIFMKVHDAYTLIDNQTPLFPADASRSVIYFLRNPLMSRSPTPTIPVVATIRQSPG